MRTCTEGATLEEQANRNLRGRVLSLRGFDGTKALPIGKVGFLHGIISRNDLGRIQPSRVGFDDRSTRGNSAATDLVCPQCLEVRADWLPK